MCGSIAFPAALVSPTCLPAACSRRWRVPRPRPARRLARPAFRKCANAVTRRVSLAGLTPGLLLVGLFAISATFRYAAERRTAVRDFAAHGRTSSLLSEERYTLRERLAYAPRVLPFVLLLTGVMIAL